MATTPQASQIGSSWLNLLQEEFQKPYLKQLAAFLKAERALPKPIYPPPHQVFNAFLQTPYEDVKVVIVGQDPYHQPGQAHGLSFSVQPGVRYPPSLRNIFQELIDDVQAPLPPHGCLLSWAKQGVLLLNATLTVREGEPRSHYGKGWEEFTDRVIGLLLERKDPVIFLLWGRSAHEKVDNVPQFQQHKHHHRLLAAHPSPYSVTGFFGCRHFSKCNKILTSLGKTPIDWAIS